MLVILMELFAWFFIGVLMAFACALGFLAAGGLVGALEKVYKSEWFHKAWTATAGFFTTIWMRTVVATMAVTEVVTNTTKKMGSLLVGPWSSVPDEDQVPTVDGGETVVPGSGVGPEPAGAEA